MKLLALLAIALLEPTRLPWNLMVAVKEKDKVVWVSAKYLSQEECEEDLLLLTLFNGPKIADAYCERDPHMT